MKRIFIYQYQHLLMAIMVMFLSFVYYGLSPKPHVNKPAKHNPAFEQFLTSKIDSAAKATLPAVPKIANCDTRPCVALTFDDGPEANTTPKVLDILEQKQAVATFFVIGLKVAGKEAILKRMQKDGFEIGNHSWDHIDFTKMDAQHMNDELSKTNQALVKAGVAPSHIFRPPYGDINKNVMALDWPLVLWNTDPKDWSHKNPEDDVGSIIGSVKPGAIIVMHDTQDTTVKALPEIINDLKKANYRFVTVSQLLGLNSGSRGIYFNHSPTGLE